MKTIPRILLLPLLLTGLLIFVQLNAFAQQKYGDLELTVLGNGTESAIGIPVKAIDPDLEDTTYKVTDENSQAYFEDLYIDTIDGQDENKGNKLTFEGLVRFYDIQGRFLNERMSNTDGSVMWNGIGKTVDAGIYIAKGENGSAVKFVYMNQPSLIGKQTISSKRSFKGSAWESSRTYELHADGRGLEWNPFAEFMEEHELFADIINYVQLNPPVVIDGPSSGDVEILVEGKPAGDNSELALVRSGEIDTNYFYTINGVASFDAASHPFDKFTRSYTMLIRSNDADSNWFHEESHEVEIALGAGNDFLFEPNPITDEERTAEVTLEIILSNDIHATSNAEVKAYRLGSTDTTFTYTNSLGIAEFTRLVHPFQPDAHELSINSDQCNDTLFMPLTESHSLLVGQNNIEMNPNPVAEDFAEGLIETLYSIGGEDNVEVKVWRLNNTIDTNTYVTNAAGRFYYDNLPIEGSSSDYVFKSYKDAEDGNPVLISIDTFNLIPEFNPMHTIYLETISQFITTTGTIREFYTQSTTVAGVIMEVREADGGPTIGSSTTDANGFYSISGIPSGAETEIVMTGLANHFHRIHSYTFHEVFVEEDTLLPDRNMLHVPDSMQIPQPQGDPAPANLLADAAEVAELVGYDQKNGEQIARFENRINLVNFWTPSDSLIYFGAEETIDSLFYKGEGSPLVLVANTVNITTYHILNYDINIGFPGELGWNLTYGGGNVTTPIYSSSATGGYVIGGEIHVMSGLNGRIKELEHRRKQLGDVTSRPSFGNPTNATMPDHKDRAYVYAIDINLDARVMTGNEVFPLDGLTTTTKAANSFQTGEMEQPYK